MVLRHLLRPASCLQDGIVPKTSTVLLSLIVLSLVPAWAAPLIIFNVGDSGTISYAGDAAPLMGTSISITSLLASGDPQNDGAYGLQDGVLSFQTGDLIGYDSSRQLLTFGANGSITITGTVITPDGPITGSAADPLLVGSFVGATFDLNANHFSLFLGDGPDVKNASLVSYFYGSSRPTWAFDADIYALSDVSGDYHNYGTFSTSVVDRFTIGGDTFYSQVVNVDAPAPPTPEPGTMILMGTALIAISVALRRSRKSKAK